MIIFLKLFVLVKLPANRKVARNCKELTYTLDLTTIYILWHFIIPTIFFSERFETESFTHKIPSVCTSKKEEYSLS